MRALMTRFSLAKMPGRGYNSPLIPSPCRLPHMTSSSGKPRTAHTLASAMVRGAGVRMTRQRRAVLEVIVASCDHPTAATIHERTREACGNISLATIYNCLDTMVAAGIINQLNFDNGPARYCANFEPHVHLLDDQSQQVIDVRLRPGVKLEDVFTLPEGARICRMDACLHGIIPAHLSNRTHS